MCSLFTCVPSGRSVLTTQESLRVSKRKIKGWYSKCQSIQSIQTTHWEKRETQIVYMNMPPPSIKKVMNFRSSVWLHHKNLSSSSSSSLLLLIRDAFNHFTTVWDYFREEISFYWLLVWWLSRLQANISLFNVTGMCSSYLERHWCFQPVCQVWTAASYQH